VFQCSFCTVLLIDRLVREVIKIVGARLEETQVGSRTEGLARVMSECETFAKGEGASATKP